MHSPWRFWCSVWLSLLLLTLYGADELERLVVETPWLAERGWALGLATGAVALSERSGLATLHDRVDALRGEPALAVPTARNDGAAAPERTAASEPTTAPHAASRPSEPRISPTTPAGAPVPARRILLLGASSMQFALGTELERLLSTRPGLVVLRHGKASTGLVRSDVVDWPTRATALVREFEPDLVITNFGGNDAQGMLVATQGTRGNQVLPFGSPEWDQAYGERVGILVEAARTRGSRIVMLGMPIMRQASYGAKIAHVNAVTKAAVERGGGSYLSTWEMASDAAGKYKSSLTWHEKTGPMRMPDGHHYTSFGGQYVASLVVAELERQGVLEALVTKP